MRTSILGMMQYHDLPKVIENTKNACKVTHADPRCVASCVAVTMAIALMLQGKYKMKSGEYDVDGITKEAHAIAEKELEKNEHVGIKGRIYFTHPSFKNSLISLLSVHTAQSFKKAMTTILLMKGTFHKTSSSAQNIVLGTKHRPRHKTSSSAQNIVLGTKHPPRQKTSSSAQNIVLGTKHRPRHKTSSSAQNILLGTTHPPRHNTSSSAQNILLGHKTSSSAQNILLGTKHPPRHKTSSSGTKHPPRAQNILLGHKTSSSAQNILLGTKHPPRHKTSSSALLIKGLPQNIFLG
jgi:hypothetical protein